MKNSILYTYISQRAWLIVVLLPMIFPFFLLAMLVFWWVWHHQLAPSGRTKLSPLPTPAKIARGVKARWESPKKKEHHGYIMIMYIYICYDSMLYEVHMYSGMYIYIYTTCMARVRCTYIYIYTYIRSDNKQLQTYSYWATGKWCKPCIHLNIQIIPRSWPLGLQMVDETILPSREPENDILIMSLSSDCFNVFQHMSMY